MNSLYHTKKCDFWNDGTFTRTSSVQGLLVILKWHNLQSLVKALDLFIEFKFCESDIYYLNGSKNCLVATYNFGSVYMYIVCNSCVCNKLTVGDHLSSTPIISGRGSTSEMANLCFLQDSDITNLNLLPTYLLAWGEFNNVSVCSAIRCFLYECKRCPKCLHERESQLDRSFTQGGYNISQVPVKDYEHNFQT